MVVAKTPHSPVSVIQELSKSGIVILVLVSVLCGFFSGFPFEKPFAFGLLLKTLIGIYLLGSGSSAMNQYQERFLDAQMPRTAGRPLPSGRITPRQALAFSLSTIFVGLLILWSISAELLALGVAAVLSYNGLYTLWWKRRWAYAAVPGAIPGALPILMGYAAAHGKVFSAGGIYLFFILFFWQMPHFWVLALKYKNDYEKGGFPTLPVTYGTGITVRDISVWCLGYIALALGAPLFLGVGTPYLVIALAMSVVLLVKLRQFAREPESKRWLQFFLWINFSLIIYLVAAVVDLWSVYLVPFFTR